MLKGNGKTYRTSRALRRTMSLPEVLLWQQLRRKTTGRKCRKQHPAGPYTLDFYCDASKLCVEVDGEAHDRGDRPIRDARRDAWLAAQEIETLRIPASEILANLDGVLAWIDLHARKRAPLHIRLRRTVPLPQRDWGRIESKKRAGFPALFLVCSRPGQPRGRS